MAIYSLSQQLFYFHETHEQIEYDRSLTRAHFEQVYLLFLRRLRSVRDRQSQLTSEEIETLMREFEHFLTLHAKSVNLPVEKTTS